MTSIDHYLQHRWCMVHNTSNNKSCSVYTHNLSRVHPSRLRYLISSRPSLFRIYSTIIDPYSVLRIFIHSDFRRRQSAFLLSSVIANRAIIICSLFKAFSVNTLKTFEKQTNTFLTQDEYVHLKLRINRDIVFISLLDQSRSVRDNTD